MPEGFWKTCYCRLTSRGSRSALWRWTDLRSLLSLAGSRWFLDSRSTPPGLEVGCRRWCHVWWVASPVASDLRSDCFLPSNPPPGGTRAHCHHTGCLHAADSPWGLDLLQEFCFSRWPATSTRAATCSELGPFLLCVWCVCTGPLPFSLDPFFFLCSFFLPPTRFLLLSSPFLSVPPAPRSPSPVLLYPVTAQFFGTPRGRSTEKASPLPVHCRA
jgi:hypothetical protein